MPAEDAETPDAPPCPPPRANPLLEGHDAAQAQVRRWFASGSLPNGLMLTGPWGIGKATLAFRIARMLLRRDPEKADEADRWIAAGSHPDLLTVERKFDARRGRTTTGIVVDDVRRIGGFLATSPARGGWRVVIVDAADEMNRNAANALLKVLEEPGERSMLILVCHQPALLPATIRSRCRRVLLRPLSDAVLAQLADRLLPEMPATDAAVLRPLAEGSIGRLLQLAAHDGLTAHRWLAEVFAAMAAGEGDRLPALIAETRTGGDEDSFRVVAHVLTWWLRQITRMASQTSDARRSETGGEAGGGTGAGPAEAGEMPASTAVVAPLATTATLDRWLKVWEKTQHLAAHAAVGNLERKQALTTILLDMQCELQPASS